MPSQVQPRNTIESESINTATDDIELSWQTLKHIISSQEQPENTIKSGPATARPLPEPEVLETEWRQPLANRRYVTVSWYKDEIRVDIHEYFTDRSMCGGPDNQPKKKGISLKLEEYRKLLTLLPKIEEAILIVEYHDT
ncbi:hypothetical protein HD806DRAFT_531928 [Xylariaceae sp. AK1471]|nr:hypothetical protein HD806DRAFT_531928 [Xylariaceae sp. AK1471]